MAAPPPHRQRGQMLLEGRKHPRNIERFLVQVSSVRDPLLTDLASVENQSLNGVQLATERSWELGSHVDVKAVARNLKARARVVYCNALGPKKFVVGLNILSRDRGQANPAPVAELKRTTENPLKSNWPRREEAQNAPGEWRSYPNGHYEDAWAEASAKIQRLEAKIARRKAASGG